MIRIAIADPDESARISIRALLEVDSNVETVGEASDGHGTLTLLRSTQVDVLILGSQMHDSNSETLLREIKKQGPSVRVIVVAVLASKNGATSAFKAGASGFLVKSSLPDDLLAAIRSVSSGGVYVNL